MIRSFKIFLGLCGLIALSACATGYQKMGTEDCPKVAFVGDAAQLTQFSGEKAADEGHVVSRARFSGFEGACKVDQGMATVDLNIKFAAEKGPALKKNQTNYHYFVAVTDLNNHILEKENFETVIRFLKEVSVAETQEEVTEAIPLVPGTKASDYRLLLGFQLSAEQLAYNRNRRMAVEGTVTP